ncbi:BMC domain-containing protein [Bacillus sp. REN3]|uniref:BMC domain-containing protein n=1 Tax=Bacillus sp. REN3 TaxID=2802440 RepID=UPI0032BF96DA
MIKYEAIGVIETQYFAVASEILDKVCKGANVEFLSSEKYLGGRLVSLIVGGSVPDIEAAIDIAKRVSEDKPGSPLKMALAITNPHEEIMKYIIPGRGETPAAGQAAARSNKEGQQEGRDSGPLIIEDRPDKDAIEAEGDRQAKGKSAKVNNIEEEK